MSHKSVADVNTNQQIDQRDGETFFQAAVRSNLESGILLLCKEQLVTAICDRRLDRQDLIVYCAIMQSLNYSTGRAWPARSTLAAMTGYTLKSVTNALSNLKKHGYVIAERCRVLEAENRSLTTYTLGNVDHESIRRAITDFVRQIRDARTANCPIEARKLANDFAGSVEQQDAESAPYAGHSAPHSAPYTGQSDEQSAPHTGHSDQSAPYAGQSSAPHTGHFESESAPYEGQSGDQDAKSAPYAGQRYKRNTNPIGINNITNTTRDVRARRGSRLCASWVLPKSWGEWALQTYDVTPAKIRAEAERFKNHWLSVPGQKGVKLDWRRTWQNWCASDFRAWPRRPDAITEDVAPDLISAADSNDPLGGLDAETRALLDERRKMREALADE